MEVKMKLKEEFNIKGRGKVITARLDDSEECPDIGTRIEWKGKEYEVIAVERFMKLLSPPIPGNNIGLLVREVKDERRP